MLHSGYEYSAGNYTFKIKWSALSDQPHDYRLETCGDCKCGCTRCKCYYKKLSCTLFCKCDRDVCLNRNIYGSSSQQLRKEGLSKLKLTTSTVQEDNEYDEISIVSQCSNINNTNAAEIEFDTVSNQSYIDSQIEYENDDVLQPVKRPSFSSTTHDHTYCSKNDVELVASKRRRLSSTSSICTDSQLMLESPRAHSSPKSDRTINTATSSSFRTPLAPTTSTPRQYAHFRKFFGKRKTHSQPNITCVFFSYIIYLYLSSIQCFSF
ncbi:unnamed protein product [Rotaria sp. Silwood2]|nr:unnamed protein product [Rotaria sp. Silwood2]CAF3159656.1 unnamed protein product [Rotaria sp. Silwood2]CAF3370230.1 unnamed protein product [Rotaria sp. Silwood2]CAF3468120.1 unnamed protein product [Rotaria sp. Silwood2]CAF4056150.1 unnamed protein product [Rotaria sp. Silwood2]